MIFLKSCLYKKILVANNSINITVRIDKWLWAARFFRTRSKAKVAIEGGKVKVDGRRVKASYELKVGNTLNIRQISKDFEVEVLVLCDRRKSASNAKLLYLETDTSILKRADLSAARQLAENLIVRSDQRPDKKARRQIQRLKKSY